MSAHPEKCLFELWQSTSAPTFHTTELWPKFEDAQVRQFLASDDAPLVANRPVDRDRALQLKGQINAFLSALDRLPETEYACSLAYRAFEEERLATINLALEAEDSVQAQRYNDQLYGELSTMHHDEIVAYLKHYVQHLIPNSQAVAEAQATLLELWQDVAPSVKVERYFETFEGYIRQLKPLVEHKYGFVEELLVPYRHHATLDAATTGRLVDQAIDGVLGIEQSGWTAAVRDGVPNVFIDHAHRTIVMPAGRNFAPEHARTLIIHEIGVHVARAVSGARSRERLASVGMAGYGAVEEAFGVFLENTPSTKPYTPIFSLIAFASLDFAQRLAAPTFRSLYDLNRAIHLCVKNPDPEQLEQGDEDQRRGIFSRTIRMMRLGTGAVVDRSLTKYWRGHLLLTDHLAQAPLTQAVFDEFFLGKYDCNNPAQLSLIRSHQLPG